MSTLVRAILVILLATSGLSSCTHSDVIDPERGGWVRSHRAAPWGGRDAGATVVQLWLLGGRLMDPVQTVAEAWTTRDGSNWKAVTMPPAIGPRHAAYVAEFRIRLWWIGGSANDFPPVSIWFHVRDSRMAQETPR
jgi:hypothetical protein